MRSISLKKKPTIQTLAFFITVFYMKFIHILFGVKWFLTVILQWFIILPLLAYTPQYVV
jgi:hypothetical protein